MSLQKQITTSASWFDADRVEGTNDWIITSNIFFSANIRIFATVNVIEIEAERISTDKGVLEIDGGLDVDIEVNSIEYAIGESEDYQPLPFEVHPNDVSHIKTLLECEADVFLR